MLAAYGAPLTLAAGAVLVYRAFHAGVPLALAPLGLADVRRLLRRAPPPDDVATQFESTPTTVPCPSAT